MTYRDMTFCSKSLCVNRNCARHYKNIKNQCETLNESVTCSVSDFQDCKFWNDDPTDCIYRMKAVKFDYSGKGCKHTDMEGFICAAPEFLAEGEAIWMTGLKNGCVCEMYEPK